MCFESNTKIGGGPIVTSNQSRTSVAVPSVESPSKIMSTKKIQKLHQRIDVVICTITFTNFSGNQRNSVSDWSNNIIPTFGVVTIIKTVRVPYRCNLWRIESVLRLVFQPFHQRVRVLNTTQSNNVFSTCRSDSVDQRLITCNVVANSVTISYLKKRLNHFLKIN